MAYSGIDPKHRVWDFAMAATVQLDANGAALLSNTTAHDAIVNISNYGDVLETSTANALGHTNRSRTDGVGRSIQSVDAANFVTNVKYDANGNLLYVRDPNNVGQDCVYDALNRDKQCADTQEILDNVNRRKVFNLAGQVIQEIDAKTHATTHIYDARGRKASTTDRISATTVWTYDLNGNETSMSDAENQTTSYGYDVLKRRVSIQ
jgi:YD repeat-containing protein